MPLSLRVLILCVAAALLAPAGASARLIAGSGGGEPAAPSGAKKHDRKGQPRRQRARRPARVSRPRRRAVHPRRAVRPARARRSDRRPAHRHRAPQPTPPAIKPGLSDFSAPEQRPQPERKGKPAHRRARQERQHDSRRRERPRAKPRRAGNRTPGTRERAMTYLGARDVLRSLPFNLGDPLVAVLDRAAGRDVRRQARRVERRRERRALVRDKAKLYLRGLAALDSQGRRTHAIASALSEGGDPRVRKMAKRITERRRARRRERRRERRQAVLDRVYGADIGGPELIDRPTWGKPLPWNATFVSGTVGCERQLYPRGAMSCIRLGPRPSPLSASLGFEVTRTSSRSEERLHTDGKRYVDLGLSSDYRLTGSGKAELARRGGIALEGFLGREVSYTLNVSPNHADSIADGNADAPHPLDPRSLGQGESIELSRENYSGNGQSASYRLLQLQLGYSEGRRVSSGVRRLGGDRIRIYVGDEQVVQNALQFGIGTDDLGVAAGLSDEFADGKLRTTDLDLGTRAGWNSYQRFIGSGHLPRSPSNPGIRDASVVDSASWASSRTLELHAGPVHLGGTWNPYDGEVTETLHENGSRERAVTSRDHDVTYIRSSVKRRGGRWRAARLSLLLQDAEAETVEGLLDLRGRSVSLDGAQDVLLDFSPSDLSAVRQDALEELSFYTQGLDEPMSPGEVDAYLASQDDYGPSLPVPGGGDRHLLAIATATGPGEILDALTYGSFGNASSIAFELAALQAFDGRDPVPPSATQPGRVVLLD